jgi:hypothetical protein
MTHFPTKAFYARVHAGARDGGFHAGPSPCVMCVMPGASVMAEHADIVLADRVHRIRTADLTHHR